MIQSFSTNNKQGGARSVWAIVHSTWGSGEDFCTNEVSQIQCAVQCSSALYIRRDLICPAYIVIFYGNFKYIVFYLP